MNVRELAQQLVELDARGFGDEPIVWVDRSAGNRKWRPQEFTTIEVTTAGVELDLS